MKNFSRLERSLAQPLLLISVTVLLAACSSAPKPSGPSSKADYPEPNKGRYAQQKDSIPLRFPTADEMIDPEPSVEPLSRGGNKPYNIYGIDYYPTTTITEYSETGTASWYGNKFHGHLTSNVEVYDVYAMTAAHKTLPLPSYVRVTNLDNFRSAVVRVNDRGPFHDGRVIDLSYSAAYKLGIYQTGTGRVKVELIASPAMQNMSSFATPIAQQPMIPYEPLTETMAPPQTRNTGTLTAPVSLPPPVVSHSNTGQGCFIQLIASSDRTKVDRLGNEIQQQWSVTTAVQSANGIFKLLAGPFNDSATSARLLENLRSSGYPDAFFTNKQLCSG
ncbi:MAG: septal ring lytic transglycosylase RlpA family protein [Rheinheimera sp.]